jgi:type VI secretion system protein ImpK
VPDDPFAERPVERTVFMPMPGGRAASARPAAPEPEKTVDTTTVTRGLNPLLAAANPLLSIVPRLRASAEHPNPTALRERLAQGVRQFESRMRTAGVSSEKIVAARYALCTLIDETASSTPWGASGAWAQRGLLALFHGETGGGERFFQLLAKLAENPEANLALLELMYVCLQLGFEGRYRVVDGGQRQLEAIRQRLLAIIRKQRGARERDLSPSWRGVSAAPQPRLGWLPLWVVGAVAALVLVGIFLGFRLSLGGASAALAGDIARLRVAARVAPAPVPAAVVKPASEPRLAPFFVGEVERGLVAVEERADRSIVTLVDDSLFKPGEATVGVNHQRLLSRIGEVLSGVPGQLDVTGHTDNTPIRTLRFPSNWELSKARAEAVTRLLGGHIPPGRLRAQGRGDSEPVADNATAQSRAKNRRVEITLYVPASTPEGAPELARRP